MSAEIWVAIITGFFTLVGVIITVAVGNSKTVYRIEQLEKKQDKHNTLIERMYRLEDRVTLDEEKIKVANHRIADLESDRKEGR